MLVFMDHSSRSSNPVNHQMKKERSVHRKPEWQKSAIRTCGYWSEQLSSKGKIYFYNCMTEVSQWQKPPEWNLPEMNRRDLLRLLSERKHNEENNLKRPHATSETESGAVKGDRSLPPTEFKRTKFSYNSEVRRPSSSHLDTAVTNHAGDARYITEVLHGDGKSHVSRSGFFDSRYDLLKKTKQQHMPSRTSTTDDMEISPNSSPLSDGSSTKFPTERRISPQRSILENSSPSTFCFQRPKTCQLKGAEMTSGRDAVQKSEKSTLHQLVNAIRASIGDLLEQSPNSLSACTASKLSPSTNGMVYGSNRTSVTLGSNQGVQSQLSPSTISKGCKQSQIDDRLHPFSSFPSSNSRQLSADSPVAYSSSVEVQSRNYSVHKDTTHGTSQCLTNNKATYSVENSGHMFLSNQSPLIPHSVSSQAVNLQFRSVCRNTHQNSSSVISSSNPSSRATTGVSNNSLQTRVSLSHYDLSSRQVDKIIEMLAEQAHCKTTTEECNMHSDVSLNSSRLHDNLKNVTSPGNSARAFISHTLQTDHRLNQDPMNLNPPSQHNQLNELVQILKAALHHHTSSHLPANPAAFVSTSSRQTSGSLPDSSGSHDTIKSHSMDIGVGQESKAFISTSIQDGSSFSSQTGSRTSVTNRLVSDSFPFSRINTGIDHSGSPASACNYSNVSNSAKTNEDNSEINDRRETPNAPSPTSASPSIRSGHSTNTLIDITTKSTFSPAPASENCLVLEKISDVLDSSEMKSFFTPGLISNYQDETLQRLEQEAQIESKNFDRLQSVLYGELSAESKKLRALVRISEAKLAIHKEKQTSLQELMDAIEVRKHLPNLSFVDDVL